MKILSIETSCDETAVSIVEARGGADNPTFTVLGDALYSQAARHQEFGGVYPDLAKREHALNLTPLLEKALGEAGMYFLDGNALTAGEQATLQEMLTREPELLRQFLARIPTFASPEIDAIAVTHGPGLEPALWVGINFANALGLVWNKPVIAVNHMEGHIFGALMADIHASTNESRNYTLETIRYPLLALLISGGHTELVLMKDWFSYALIGETMDDAVGEAFDKVARMLGLPYPGGPEISKLAEQSRRRKRENANMVKHSVFNHIKLPRPMLHSDNCNFSFSGLKTAVLYTLKDIPHITSEVQEHIAQEFEDAATEVLIAKTRRALHETLANALVVGGGVSANAHIRQSFETLLAREFPDVRLFIPERNLTTDNAIMIAVAGYFRLQALQGHGEVARGHGAIRAEGRLRLS